MNFVANSFHSSKSIQVEELTSTKFAKNPIDIKKFVVHCKKSKYDVYIGRPNTSIPSKDCKWGNPFKIGRDGDRDDVIRVSSSHSLRYLEFTTHPFVDSQLM